MADETPDGEQGMGPGEGRPRRTEGDLLAERRARRAAESGEVALTRRAEAAEATVQTLERHVASLQQRLREIEEERLRTDALLEAERAAAIEREHELRRVKQREYAEQQLRSEAEDRLLGAERESRVEIERLDDRLGASEDDARELARRLKSLQRRLAEAEEEAAAVQAAASAERSATAERATASADLALQARLEELERRAQEIQRALDAERAARERTERMLESMREGHRRLELLLGELKDIVARVTTALAGAPAATSEPAAGPEPEPAASAGASSPLARPPVAAAPGEERGAEMAAALAAAVERLRARADALPPSAAELEHAEPAPAPEPPTELGRRGATAPARTRRGGGHGGAWPRRRPRTRSGARAPARGRRARGERPFAQAQHVAHRPPAQSTQTAQDAVKTPSGPTAPAHSMRCR